MKQIAKFLLVLMLALCLLTTLISCGGDAEENGTSDAGTSTPDTTPDKKPDSNEDPDTTPDPTLINQGESTEIGWSNVK